MKYEKNRTQTCEPHSNQDLSVLALHKQSSHHKPPWLSSYRYSLVLTSQPLHSGSLTCSTKTSLFLRQTDRNQQGACITCSERIVYYSPISATNKFQYLTLQNSLVPNEHKYCKLLFTTFFKTSN